MQAIFDGSNIYENIPINPKSKEKILPVTLPLYSAIESKLDENNFTRRDVCMGFASDSVLYKEEDDDMENEEEGGDVENQATFDATQMSSNVDKRSLVSKAIAKKILSGESSKRYSKSLLS